MNSLLAAYGSSDEDVDDGPSPATASETKTDSDTSANPTIGFESSIPLSLMSLPPPKKKVKASKALKKANKKRKKLKSKKVSLTNLPFQAPITSSVNDDSDSEEDKQEPEKKSTPAEGAWGLMAVLPAPAHTPASKKQTIPRKYLKRKEQPEFKSDTIISDQSNSAKSQSSSSSVSAFPSYPSSTPCQIP